jgi:hypothetical protein
MSVDGFIADLDDGTGWMTGDPGYDSKPFFASIDTVLVAPIVRSHAAAGVRSYPGLRTYVFSRTLKAADYPEVTMLAEDGVDGRGLRGRAERTSGCLEAASSFAAFSLLTLSTPWRLA